MYKQMLIKKKIDQSLFRFCGTDLMANANPFIKTNFILKFDFRLKFIFNEARNHIKEDKNV